jgi:PAS domain-containing protein
LSASRSNRYHRDESNADDDGETHDECASAIRDDIGHGAGSAIRRRLPNKKTATDNPKAAGSNTAHQRVIAATTPHASRRRLSSRSCSTRASMNRSPVRLAPPALTLLTTVALEMATACSTFNGGAFVSVFSASQAVQRAFAGDLSRSRLSELTQVLAIEVDAASRQVRWSRERQVIAAYQEAVNAMRDYAVVWDVETRIRSELLPVSELPERLRTSYGISAQQDFLPVFSSVEVMGTIGETVVTRLRAADTALLAATGERAGAGR